MTTTISISAEDVPILAGSIIGAAGLLTHNMDAAALGMALIGGKAVLKSQSPDPAQAAQAAASKSQAARHYEPGDRFTIMGRDNGPLEE